MKYQHVQWMNSSMYTCLLYSHNYLGYWNVFHEQLILVSQSYIKQYLPILYNMDHTDFFQYVCSVGFVCDGTPDSYNWASLIISWCSPAFLESLSDIQKTSHSGDSKVYCLHRQWQNLTFGFSHSFISFIFNTCHPAVLTHDIGFLVSLHLLPLTFNQGNLAPVSFQDLYIMWINVIASV